MNTAREHGRHFGQAVSRVGHGVSQNLTLAVIMGVQNDTRVHGPCSRPVNTGSVYRPLLVVLCSQPNSFKNYCVIRNHMKNAIPEIFCT